MSVAIVTMVNNTEVAEMHQHGTDDDFAFQDYACPSMDDSNSTDITPDGPFGWPEPVQGLVLASYFWGYIITQFPGGRIAELFSAKWVMFGAVLSNGILTIFTPLAANNSYIALLVIRFCEGLGAGVVFPAISVMLSKWALPKERSIITSVTYAGMALGTVISLPFSGLLATTWGWEWIFYLEGSVAVAWCLAWALLIFDSPTQHPRIHQTELQLYLDTMEAPTQSAKLKIPWRAMLSSGPFWAILVAQSFLDFGWYMLLVELPTYMKNVLRFNINQSALLSAFPYLALWFFNLVLSKFLDIAKNRNWLGATGLRKLSNSVASLLPALCFIAVGWSGCDRHLAVVFMTLGTMFMAGMFSGYYINHIDISPNFTGTIMAVCNTAATLSGFIVPIFVGHMTNGHQTLERWQFIFNTTAAVLVFDFLFYLFMASAEEQPWNRPKEIDEASKCEVSQESKKFLDDA